MDKKKGEMNGPAKDKGKKNYPLLNFNHLQRFSVVIITTLSIVILFAGAGYWLDLKLGTRPWLLVILVIVSFPVTQYTVYKKMKEFTQKEFKKHGIKSE